MYTVTATFETAAEAAAFLSGAAVKPALTAADAAADLAGTPRPDNPSAEATAMQRATKPAPAPPPAEPPAQAAAPAAGKTDYPTLQKAVFTLAGIAQKQGLDTAEHVLSIAKKHGGPTFKEVPAANWAAALADVNAKVEELQQQAAVA